MTMLSTQTILGPVYIGDTIEFDFKTCDGIHSLKVEKIDTIFGIASLFGTWSDGDTTSNVDAMNDDAIRIIPRVAPSQPVVEEIKEDEVRAKIRNLEEQIAVYESLLDGLKSAKTLGYKIVKA